MEYGLIGGALGHSYSKLIHEQLCGYTYELCPLPAEADARAFLRARAFKAVNVTIPYKRLALECCDEADPRAAAIGAVNTLVNRGGRLFGYNTDYDGFSYLARAHGVNFSGRTVLVLGTGGTSRTVTAAAKAGGAKEVLYASRAGGPGTLDYSRAAARQEVQVVVNTSPAGMYPEVESCLLHPAAFPQLEAVLDVVYNPFKTELVQRAGELGVTAAGGLEMLVAQAVYAARLFTGQEIPEKCIDPVFRSIWADRANIVLVGMPSSGKTTIGRMLAKALDKRFVDLDAEIERASGQSVPSIFETQGEAGFRRWEQRVTGRFAKESGQVLSCGGGVVKTAANVRALRRNGVVLFIDRPVEKLRVGGSRPLSTDREALERMAAQRGPLYRAAADITVDNSGEPFARAAAAAKEAICAYFGIERP